MNYDKNKIDEQAEKEAKNLAKQGRYCNGNYNRIRQQTESESKIKFEKLFAK